MTLYTADLRARLTEAQNAIVALEEERELYRARWLACVTPEEATRLREANEILRAALADARVTIKALHGPIAWDIYEAHSPEMVRINAALALGAQPFVRRGATTMTDTGDQWLSR